MKKSYSFGEVFGLELEYMIVDKDTMAVAPLADLLLKEAHGTQISDHVGSTGLGWSNELVNHVIELKTIEPIAVSHGLEELIESELTQIRTILKKHNAVLLPGPMHPLMNPHTDTVLWPHQDSIIYETYDRIFNCKNHGWSNLQSVHLNLSFNGDQEFALLHSAVRVMLPLIPSLCAASPYVEGRFGGMHDMRLNFYRNNQKSVPSVGGSIIPDVFNSQEEYRRQIFKKIEKDMAQLDPEKVLDPLFLNSRGAIARFDRNAIEIRLMDIQEHPSIDIAHAALIRAVIAKLCSGKWCSVQQMNNLHTKMLKNILIDGIEKGDTHHIDYEHFLSVFGIHAEVRSAAEVWKHLYDAVADSLEAEVTTVLEERFAKGTLASRLIARLGISPSTDAIHRSMNDLVECLKSKKFFV